MEQIIKAIENCPAWGETADEENPTAYMKFYNMLGRGEWFVIEMKVTDDDLLFFGYVKSPLGSDCDEFGTFTLSQLLEVPVIDLDTNFNPVPIMEVI